METIKVQYTVKESFVETNKANISKVMADLKAVNSPDIKYSTFMLDDGQTFVHLVMRTGPEAHQILAEMPSFQAFQQQLKESEPPAPPNAENLSLVAASWDIL